MTMQPLSQSSSRAVPNKDKQLNHKEEEPEMQEQTRKKKMQLSLIRIDDDEEQENQDGLHRIPPRGAEEVALPPQTHPGAVAVRGLEHMSSDQSTAGTIVVGDDQRTSSTRPFHEGSHVNQDLAVAAEVAPTDEDIISKVEDLMRQTENDMQRHVLEQVQSALQQTTRAEVVSHETQNDSEGAPMPIEESATARTTKSKLFWWLIAILIIIVVVVIGITVPKGLKTDTQKEVRKEGCTTDASCSVKRADGICNADGQCLIVACEENYEDCNQNAYDGCETNLQFDDNHCASCDNQCNLANADSDCVEGLCVVSSCLKGFDNCDDASNNGCETNLQMDDNHCGSCDAKCSLANAYSKCEGGSCVITGCMVGFGNCDGVSNSGCETNLLLSNDKHCGACDRQCDFLSSCSDGVCYYNV